MSKGIIVLDKIPEYCEECPCCYTDNYDYYCKAAGGKDVDWEDRPTWCSIKKLSEEVEIQLFREGKM